jgi:hypothetical protein
VRKTGLFAGIVFLAAGMLWSQTFELPSVTNNIESIKTAFTTIIQNAKYLGQVEYSYSWASSRESAIRHYTEYFDNVLTNMTYKKIESYVATIRTAITQLDRQDFSNNELKQFDDYLKLANRNYAREATFLNEQINARSSPISITVNYDHSQLVAFDKQAEKHEELLLDYHTQLALLPPIAEIQSQLTTVQDEIINSRNQRNSQQLKNKETALMNQMHNNAAVRQNLSKNIRTIETYLNNLENERARLAARLEQSARSSYISNVIQNLNNFSAWEAFFADTNTVIRDFFVLNNARENLYHILDEIPQRQAETYRQKLDAFCAEWGI